MSTMTLSFSSERIAQGAKEMAGILCLLFGMAAVSHCGTGCTPDGQVQVPTNKEMNYTVDLTACSAGAATLAEAKACRKAVNQRYGLCGDPWPRVTPCDE